MMATKKYPIQLRFADIDVMGHVNNAHYLHYFETARMHFLNEELGEWNWRKHGLVLAKNEIHYKVPVTLEDKVEVEIYCSKIGDKSFTLQYNVMGKEKIFATGESVVVCFDYEQNASISIPERLANVLKKFLN